MAALSNFLAAELQDHVLRGDVYTPPTSVYVALHTSSPGPSGDSSSEMVGMSYARQECAFATASPDSASSDALSFVTLPDATVTYAGIWDSLAGGNLLYYVEFEDPLTVEEGGSIELEVADVVVAMD